MADVPQKATWWAYMSEWAGYLNTWFINNNHPAGEAGLAQTYYDGEMCGYRLKDHFMNTAYDNFINEGWLAYTEYYVRPNNGNVQGYRNFTEGELQDVLRGTSRAANSLDAINRQLLNGSYVASGDVSDDLLSRECAYALHTHINAVRAGISLNGTQTTRRTQLKTWALGHIDQWCVNFTAQYFRPFMGAITAKALIDYYENVSADAAIISKLKILADYTWLACWKSSSGAWGDGQSFLYTDRTGFDPADGFTQPDLNLLIVPLWGWLFKQGQGASYRTNGDLIFQGGIPVYSGGFYVSGAYLGTQSAANPSGKQYDQQLYWGPRYIEWAEFQAASMSVTPTTLVANSVGNVVTVTGVGTTWTPGTPGTPTFTIAGVTGAQITGQVINSSTSATLTVTASTGGNTGVAVISDGTLFSNGITITPVPPAASMSVSPTTVVANSVGNVVTVTGVNTTWTPGTPGTPTFTIAGVTGAQITSQVINSPTSATLTVTASTGGNTGSLTISDGTLFSNAILVIAASLTVSPSSIGANSTGNIVTATGVGTTWTPGTPGSPTFTISGVTGAQITSQVVNSATSATLTVTASTGGNTGTLVISDGTLMSNSITVTPPLSGCGKTARRRPF